MIESSICFLSGVGWRTERQLWQRGIGMWANFRSSSSIPGIGPSRKALYMKSWVKRRHTRDQGDAWYFATELSLRQLILEPANHNRHAVDDLTGPTARRNSCVQQFSWFGRDPQAGVTTFYWMRTIVRHRSRSFPIAQGSPYDERVGNHVYDQIVCCGRYHLTFTCASAG